MYKTLSDEQLVADYLAGEEKALEVLIKRYLKSIYNFAYGYVGMNNAEDITQETFVKMWKNIGKFDQDKSFKSWLFAIAKNSCLDFLKMSRTAAGAQKTVLFSKFENETGDNLLIDTLTDNSPLPQELFEQKELVLKLDLAMGKLSPQNRETISLYYKDGLNFREISEFLKEPLHTVKSRCRRGLEKLRGIIRE